MKPVGYAYLHEHLVSLRGMPTRVSCAHTPRHAHYVYGAGNSGTFRCRATMQKMTCEPSD